eukprot:4861098-Pleurochrysis_carterae.AAC.2
MRLEGVYERKKRRCEKVRNGMCEIVLQQCARKCLKRERARRLMIYCAHVAKRFNARLSRREDARFSMDEGAARV